MEQPTPPLHQTPQSRWTAISRRDPAAHYSFYYGVKTTGIYCRPTCTARIARRANVKYFDTIEQAQQDGFRPCQKCRPDDVGFIGQREAVVLSALDLLRARKLDAAVRGGQKELAREVGVTPSYLCRAFKRVMGTTIGEYMRQFEDEVGNENEMAKLNGQDECSAGRSNTESSASLGIRCGAPKSPNLHSVSVSGTTGAGTKSQPWLNLDPPQQQCVLPLAWCSDSFVSSNTLHSTDVEESPERNFNLGEWVEAEESSYNERPQTQTLGNAGRL